MIGNGWNNVALAARCSLVVFSVLSTNAYAWSPRCALKVTQCVTVQGRQVPLAEAQGILVECRDFTRNNIGQRALRMSTKEILDVSGENLSHPLLKASLAYDALHDSSLVFDRSVSIEQRYFPVKRACGQVFKDMRMPTSPHEAE